jgi:protein-S-isoprenylcysteine O-methyltransferase Ste14
MEPVANTPEGGDRHDSPKILAPPPFIFLGALVLGLLLQALRPWRLFAHTLAIQFSGALLIVAGLALSAWVVHSFRQAQTPVSPLRASQHLVVSGPYRFSRNPDYLGQTLAFGGLALLLHSFWLLLAILPALGLVRYRVIAAEERYLEDRFGDAYREYRHRVRRWL